MLTGSQIVDGCFHKQVKIDESRSRPDLLEYLLDRNRLKSNQSQAVISLIKVRDAAWWKLGTKPAEPLNMRRFINHHRRQTTFQSV